jgi:hypothetical protein
MFVKNFFLFFFLTLGLGFPLPCIHIVSHLGAFVKRFFNFFSVVAVARPHPPCGLLSLTDKGIIAHPVADCNRQNAQIAGFLFFVFCATFPLDKLLGPWYNGNSARAHSRPGRQMSIGNFAQKKVRVAPHFISG